MIAPLSVMENCFATSSGTHRWADACAMAKELGFAGVYLAPEDDEGADDILARAAQARALGLEVPGIYLVLDVLAGPAAHVDRFRALVADPQAAPIELSLLCGTDKFACEGAAWDGARALIAEAAQPASGAPLRLYPHVDFWIERIDQAQAALDALDMPAMQVAFSALHWHLEPGAHPGPVLRTLAAQGRLGSVNICGMRRASGSDGLPFSIERLGSGEFDSFTLLTVLDRLGYAGPVVLQGYAVGGDVYASLRTSIIAYEDLRRRVASHPHWAVPDPA